MERNNISNLKRGTILNRNWRRTTIFLGFSFTWLFFRKKKMKVRVLVIDHFSIDKPYEVLLDLEDFIKLY